MGPPGTTAVSATVKMPVLKNCRTNMRSIRDPEEGEEGKGGEESK